MPRSKKKSPWGKRATFTGVVLGLVASVPMNLLSGWLQEINIFYLVLVFLLIAAIIYSGWKMRTPDFLNNIFWLLLATVSLNLLSTWIQFSLLHNTYSFPTVTLFLAASVIILALGALFQSHLYSRKKQSIITQRVWNARRTRPPEFQGIDGMKRPLPKPRRRRKRKA